MKIIPVVSAIIRRDDKILMVQQPDQNGLYWFIPGGMVESGEMLTDSLRREVKEETGLTITCEERLAFVVQSNTGYEAQQVMAFVFEIAACYGEILPDDPDELINDVAFVPLEEAIQRLSRVRYVTMREPLVAYLKGETPPGQVWQYRQFDESFELIARVP